MPKNVKKFNLTYDLIPKIFSLSKSLYLSNTKIATSILNNSLEQTEEQKKHVAAIIDQIDKDSDRTCYVDFTGRKASQLRADWLTISLSDEKVLTKGVFPTFIQGDSTSACVGEIIHTKQLILPISENEPESLLELMESTQRICFSYRTDDGKPAGFSLIASAHGDSEGKHQGWIISTIQNTTSPYKDRKVTVLASPNYMTTKAQTMTAMDNPTNIETELKAAIHNDKIVQLIKRIFNQDGSLNEMEIKRLKSRIVASLNIDDRDRKEAQFNCLLDWSRQKSPDDLEDPAITEDIDFFEDGIYETHLKKKLEALATSLRKDPKITKTTSELTVILNNISERVANLEMLAEKSYRNIELANTYKALAKRIKLESTQLKFDGTRHDENKIILLSKLDVTQLDKKIKRIYATDPTIQEYYTHKKQSNQQIEEQLARLPNPSNSSFLSRNSTSIGWGSLGGLLTAAVLGAILFPLLPPLTLALALLGTALVIGGVLSGIGIYNNEKKHAEKINQYHDKVSKIRLDHNQELQTAEQNLQSSIDLDAFLEPEKPEFLSTINHSKRKPLTAEKVAHTLWLKDKDEKTTSAAKNKFALWAAKNEELGFGIKEVEEVIDKQYEMHS